MKCHPCIYFQALKEKDDILIMAAKTLMIGIEYAKNPVWLHEYVSEKNSVWDQLNH